MDGVMQTFDLEQLRTLAAVIDAGSLTAAAPRVFLSQSSVSEKMRKLDGVLLTETMIAFRVFTKAAVEGMFDLGS